MKTRKSRMLLAACAAMLAWSGLPREAQAQSILKRIKEQAVKRVDDGRAKIDSTVLKTTGTAVDSAVTKTNRGADAVAGRVGTAANTALSATEQGVTKALGGAAPTQDLSARLATGRLVLDEIRFVNGSDQLDPSADATLKQLASALSSTSGAFLIEGHTDATTPAADAQALSQKRASAVKTRLVAAGVSAERLLAIGYAASRPNAAKPQANARIEVARAQ